MFEFIWRHEHEAVTGVEQSKWKVSRLAADVVLLSNMTYRFWQQDDPTGAGIGDEAPLPNCIFDASARQRILDGGPGATCPCGHCLCARTRPSAVNGTWARFTEGFCREQARLVAQHGPPSWTKPRIARRPKSGKRLETYWTEQAAAIVCAGDQTDEATQTQSS